MSKSKKNTIDPDEMIRLYGADTVRLFMLLQPLRKRTWNGAIPGRRARRASSIGSGESCSSGIEARDERRRKDDFRAQLEVCVEKPIRPSSRDGRFPSGCTSTPPSRPPWS
jgi:hypothetical protein